MQFNPPGIESNYGGGIQDSDPADTRTRSRRTPQARIRTDTSTMTSDILAQEKK
jgi:hypothetical protein